MRRCCVRAAAGAREGALVVHIEVDAETYRALVEQAVVERRPIDWQAEVALRRAMGLPFPPEAAPVERAIADSPGRE